MTNMQRLVLVLAIVFAVLLGILVATTFLGGSNTAGPNPTPTATPAALATPTGSVPPAPSGSPAPSDSATPSAEASASPSASATPTPSPTPIPLAKISIMQLTLDAASDAAGVDRVVTFTASKGNVVVQLSSATPSGNAKMCLSAGTKSFGCKTAAGGKLTAKVTGGSVAFTLTLRGDGASTPVVNVAISFPALKPKVKIEGARFDGTASPATNGLQVIVTPRKKGYVHVDANWGGHAFLYEVDLIEQGGAGVKTLANQGPATLVSQGFSIAPPNGWMVVLQNIEAGFGATGLTATYTWP